MAELVLKKIARPDLDAEVITIPTQLVKRESCPPLSSAEQGAATKNHTASLDAADHRTEAGLR